MHSISPHVKEIRQKCCEILLPEEVVARFRWTGKEIAAQIREVLIMDYCAGMLFPKEKPQNCFNLYRSTVFWTPSSLKLCSISQGTSLLMSYLGRCFISMPSNQPGRIVLTLELVQRQAEVFYSIKGLEP